MSSPESEPSNTYHNTRIQQNESPIDVDSNKTPSPVRVDVDSPPPPSSLRQSPPPMNLIMPDSIRMTQDNGSGRLEAPMPLRLGAPHQIPSDHQLRIQVSSPNKISMNSAQNTFLSMPQFNGGIVRISPSTNNNPQNLHRPFSPSRLT